MTDLDPTLVVLLVSSVAACAAALGVVPQWLTGRLPPAALGWGNALAAGVMLGVAYALLYEGLGERILAGGAGAVIGLLAVRLSHASTGTADLDLNRLDELEPAYGYQVVLVNSLHAAYEGIAIGAAMTVSLPFGISMAAALALHNIPEAMLLGAILSGRGVPLPHSAGLAVATNLNQVLLAVVVFAVVGAAPVLLPWALGFAVGALVYLVMAELLPEAYGEAGHTSIALVAILAMGVVVALGGTG